MAQVTHISDIYSQNDNNIVSKKRLGCFNKTTKILKEGV